MSMNLSYSIREGFLGLKRTRLATFITESTVAISLTLLSFFLLLTLNAGQFVGIFQEKMTIEVFIDNSLNENSIQSLKEQLQKCAGVKQIQYVSPEQALEQFRKELGEDPLEILGENPLPSSFHINLHQSYQTPDRAEEVLKCLQSCAGVDEVIFHGRLIKLLNQYRRVLVWFTFLLFIIVLLATLLLVSNTLRLTIYAQRDKIIIMELVGATSKFIRRPYWIQGILQGGAGGVMSSLFIWILIQVVHIRFPNLLKTTIWIYAFPVVLGILLGFIGSVMGVRRFLKA